MTGACETCGQPFTAAPSRRRRFCSKSCARRAERRLEPRACRHCDSTFQPREDRQVYCSRRCANTQIARDTAPGRADRQRGTGTTYRYVKRGGRHEHRVVAEQMLGRPLRAGEVVHHINNNGRDNRPENLEVLTRAEHSRIHTQARHDSRRSA